MTISLRDGETLQDYAVRVTAELNEARAEREDWADIARAGRMHPDEPWPSRALERIAELEAERDAAHREVENKAACHRCVSCAKWVPPSSAGTRWCDQLQMFRPASFGCIEWRPALKQYPESQP